MNRPQRNNNPINLRFAKQTEATGQDDAGFAIFPTPATGWRAAHAQIRLDQSRNYTLKEFIFKFAPPGENDTESYLEFMALSLQVGENIILSKLSPFAIAGCMAQREGYYAK